MLKLKHHTLFSLLAISAAALFIGCQEDLDIADFADEYGEYQSELRIEAILDVVDPMSSIVRVDRSILVTDTAIFNGRDDDGDWYAPYDDVGEDGMRADNEFLDPDEGEGNGRPDPGEPHVDEIDEILPLIHDSTLTVVLNDLTANRSYEFTWATHADSFTVEWDIVEGGGIVVTEEVEYIEMVTYGAYKPVAFDDTIALDHEYQFVLTDGDRTITGPVQPLPPPVFESEDSLMVGDTLHVIADSLQWFTWTIVPEATVFWVLVEQIHGPDSVETITSHPSAPLEQRPDGTRVGRDFLSIYFPGLYRWTISVPSRAYGAYVYSQLPLRDEQVSNFRDQDGNVVLGIAGSAADASQYVRILPP
ncbi:MAG: hypothetical protein JSU61_07665 [Fidelibacterota bacterium]|nr:MAG: hypothetical protein JSU61_07665 [Candidatus Neomarinimicrobiota bacterium]